MSSRSAPRVLTVIAVLTMVASVIGFVVTLILNAFVLDEYDAYGEVSIPGSGSIELPEGEATISFHTIVIGGGGSGLPVPELSINIVPPEGVDDPVLTEDFGTSTFVNNDARVRVWIAQIPAAGTYQITTDGNVGAFLNPSLAFGHGTEYGWVTWLFVGIFGFAVVDLIIARVWAASVKRKDPPFGGGFGAPPAYGSPPSFGPPSSYGSTGYPQSSYVPPAMPQPQNSYVPTDQGIRLEQLNTIARLRDSGALTQDEFETEKKRILGGG